MEYITVRGARQHNLKNITVTLPRDRLVVFTGVSGSGKSSLAFDTIFAEGCRRYLEALSTHSRQFLEQFDTPDVDAVEGLSPTIAVQQRGFLRNPRSTVGTLTEIHDFLRILFSQLGTPFCTACGQPVRAHTIEQMVDTTLSEFSAGSRLLILSPLGVTSARDLPTTLLKLRQDGFSRVRIEGCDYELDPLPHIPRRKAYQIELVVDRIILRQEKVGRLKESLELAVRISGGRAAVSEVGGLTREFSESTVCLHCGRSLPESTTSLFSFNHPAGACSRCRGLGGRWPGMEGSFRREKESGGDARLMVGEPSSDHFRSRYFSQDMLPCEECNGTRFNEAARAVKLGGLAIHEVSALTLEALREWLQSLSSREQMGDLTRGPINEILHRLKSLERLSLNYLTLNRAAVTLSGGELQRIRLARQVNSELTGILYVLDEPSAGLHPRDLHRVLTLLVELKEKGNSIIVVEHDRDTILQADHVVDLGPGAGKLGGEVVFSGPPEALIKDPSSSTGLFLAGRKALQAPSRRVPFSSGTVKLMGASGHNLKGFDVAFPIACLTCVTGVSGSGKTTLVLQTLCRALRQTLHGSRAKPAPHLGIENANAFDKVILVDQSPLGKTSRSTPATATGVFTLIRRLFAQLPEARARGYGPERFSFNVKGGRCEICRGEGVQTIPMGFMPDVYQTCTACSGTRYQNETLDVLFKGHSIAQVLDMNIVDAGGLFENVAPIYKIMSCLIEVGLGYLKLGQPSNTLSGGEAQRVKLAGELARKSTGRTLYVLDEPTTGLHFEDIQRLLQLLERLIDQGNTVVMIEHHPEVVANADYIIDLGPEGGEAGGFLVAAGLPREVAQVEASHTGAMLRRIFGDRGWVHSSPLDSGS